MNVKEYRILAQGNVLDCDQSVGTGFRIAQLHVAELRRPP